MPRRQPIPDITPKHVRDFIQSRNRLLNILPGIQYPDFENFSLNLSEHRPDLHVMREDDAITSPQNNARLSDAESLPLDDGVQQDAVVQPTNDVTQDKAMFRALYNAPPPEDVAQENATPQPTDDIKQDNEMVSPPDSFVQDIVLAQLQNNGYDDALTLILDDTQDNGTVKCVDAVDSIENNEATEPTSESDVICAICLSSVALYGVRTSCNHVYCCACLMTYWHHQTQVGRMKCPTCRSTVSSLSLVVTSQSNEQLNLDDHVDAMDCYNMRFSSRPKPYSQHARNFMVLIGYCIREFCSIRGLVWMFWARMIIILGSIVVGVFSLFDTIGSFSDSIADFMNIVDHVYLCLLLLVYVSIIIRRHVYGELETDAF